MDEFQAMLLLLFWLIAGDFIMIFLVIKQRKRIDMLWRAVFRKEP